VSASGGTPRSRPLDEVDDAVLVERAVDGDVAAFRALAVRHIPRMRALAIRLLGGAAEADDAVQETLVVVWRRLPELHDPAAVRTWLLRILSRTCTDLLRKRRPMVDIDETDPPVPESQTPERLVEVRSQRDALSDALARLPEDQRRAWVLREAAEYSYAEIAEALGLPESTVRGLLVRARKNLVREMSTWL
jgi:RNA polymerase sigma-70 factor, ECF subfamily